ncbi:MAG: sulfite exporter TauE/SafE family protein [Puniceicoccales bacterium]|jgi:uncharacterized membrane protein YfcA|nr:sulfite exporter TauE/SafE family protein [Puniceicoccales bacterium]
MVVETWQWWVLHIAALLMGVSKTGVPGIAILGVALFANVFEDVRQATGLVLPLLIAGDVVAVAMWRRQVCWGYFWRLFPWAMAGVVVGYFALRHLAGNEVKVMTGVIVTVLILVHISRRWRERGQTGQAGDADAPRTKAWLAPLMGTLAGFTTLVANAAGPLTSIFFLAVRLPKKEFVGTGAVFFMILNGFKVPFMVHLGLIHSGSLRLNVWLLPAVLAGAFAGRWVLVRINQVVFEKLVLALGLLAGLKLALG